MRTFLTVAALAATTAFAAPAVAAPSSDTISANALLIQPATLQRVDDLNFGTIIATPASSGTVTVAPDGTRSIVVGSGSLTTGPGAAVRGRFVGNGNPTGNVLVTASFPTYLSNTSDLTKTVGFTGTLECRRRGRHGHHRRHRRLLRRRGRHHQHRDQPDAGPLHRRRHGHGRLSISTPQLIEATGGGC